ncbi:hypothetical protein ALQ33_01459 [Pseudomonas syringae pv. philadelphi]|uniref:Uncharacterized protein n=1 Tax=Pseudomonas syringae pv. philadelphi TaxID=251706 RepID=A0A3M3ZSK9_9PSED|nr:hypothetical protein [Pseudomonas syringae group genomosp. 3]RMO97620.1 hypothetical protein ALQ33_01459 [Pseudomonas syringae pv. philadelphi]
MSYEHKAFIFDIDSFGSEFKPLLESCLLSGNVDQVRDFVVSNKQFLVDPYEGIPLDDNWEDMIEEKDVHQYGDFALTKYYSPVDDRGLGIWWSVIQEIPFDKNKLSSSPFLGVPVGSDEVFFDPGKMGSYFQTENEVIDSLNKLLEIEVKVQNDALEDFREFKKLLEQAIDEKKGIYVTF